MSLHSQFSKVVLKAEREIAYDSPDHLMPWGTKHDNSRHGRFNSKLYALFPKRHLNILDLGCSGGGFVRDCLNDGHLAVGLEGSDYSKKFKRAEWAIIPDFLLTCDVTATFELAIQSVEGSLDPLHFDIVTSWEFMEHIAEDDIEKVAANVKRHLKPGGLWIMSVSSDEDVVNGVALHQTVQEKDWWVRKFSELGFSNLETHVSYFNHHFVRGPKQGENQSFHLVLTADASKSVSLPKRSMKQKWFTYLYDSWILSRPQKFLARLVNGV